MSRVVRRVSNSKAIAAPPTMYSRPATPLADKRRPSSVSSSMILSRSKPWVLIDAPYTVWKADASSQIPRREKSMGVRDIVRAARRPPPSDGNHQDFSGVRRVYLGGGTLRDRQA